MAEAALFGIAKSVLKQLVSPALDEFRLLWGHKEHLEKLKNTVTTISNVLQDAARRPASDAAVQGWLAQLRAVLYEADDLFDVISIKVLTEKEKKGNKLGKKVSHFISKPYRFAFLVKYTHKVKEIRERFDAIARDIKGFNFLPTQTDPDPNSGIGKEQTHSYIPRNEVIGREQETEDLVRMLLPDYSREQRGVSVISIIGIGGLGKTTLAQLVYNDERVQKGFNLCMWACINKFSNLKQVVITLLKSATKSEPQNLDIDQLQSLFRNEIEGKRFLLVLDDVWDEDPQNWRQLKHLLVSGKDGSKVLTTTRSEIVAQSLFAIKPYFHLSGMSDESAWLLFKKIAFGEEGDQNSSEFEQLGRQIVSKCGNVPLAIITLASLLREKEKEKWFPLVNDELSKVIPDQYKKITHVLEFSYKELSYPVKRCFGYCSLFPKDYEFEKGELVRLWIAQGFGERLGNQSLEDEVEEYFFSLVKRCFFQCITRDKEIVKSIVTYKMHDLIHDLATAVARSECILVDNTSQRSWDKAVRHVYYDRSEESMVDNVCSFSHSKSLRTFLHSCEISLGENALEKLISGFRSIRVLDLSNLRIKKVPSSIGELIHLRFLDLSRNDMERLPSSICSLRQLQSLILEWCVCLKELPEDLGDLLSLRHLVLQYCNSIVKMPPGLAALTSLVTLDKLVVHNPSGGLKYLEGLDNLTGSLRIELPPTEWESATMDAEKSSLSMKSRLCALNIVNDRRGREPEKANTAMSALQPPPNLVYLNIKSFGGKEMPDWVLCLHKLVILKLDGCGRCVELPPLSHLPSLKELDISYMSSMLTMEDIKLYKPNSFFPSLETLSIRNMSNLESWWQQAPTVLPAFPRVTKVSIQDCPKLTRCIPLFPLVEHLQFKSVREEIIWHVIGSDAISSTSDCNSVLRKLEIREIGDLSSIVEAQIRHLSALQHLCMRGCKQLESVSSNGLSHLTSLEYLEIRRCEGIKWDGHEAEVRRIKLPRLRHLEIPTVNRSLYKGLKYMASLETLIIHSCFNEELQKEEEEEDDDDEVMSWKQLQKLAYIKLVLGETFSMKNNKRLLHGFRDLTSLKELNISKCKELCLSWRALLGLNCLQDVNILDVEEVIDVDFEPMMIQTQQINRSIRQMQIRGGSGEWVNEIPWKSFPFLEDLFLWGIRNLEALPDGIQHHAALQRLYIRDIPSMVSLPDWMSSLSSLSSLHLDGISEELKKRCEKLKGEDWRKIERIPNIEIE